MDQRRRTVLKTGGYAGAIVAGSAAGLIGTQADAATWNKAGFEAKATADALKIIGATAAQESRDIQIKAPDIAENGAVVPVEVTSRIANTQSISIVAEKNPFPLVATYDFSNGAEGYASTRMKMGQTSNVRAVVKAGDKYFYAVKEVKVTIGGCGG
jgi:sulfur-oxidizing protein SoxY